MYQYNFSDEIIVDSFAGGGGASTGIELALGRIVDIAINHDPKAIQMHEQNHPYTKHYCENVFDIEPLKATQGRPVALFWLSPDCTHFSKAKGGKPVKKEIRGLAWLALKWASAVRPRVIMLENVEEFQTWGPIKEGQPVKERKGETFKQFVGHLQNLGYQVEWRVLKACDYGAPTIRKRFFLIARCDGQPTIWPEATHGPGKLPYRTAAEIIDWSIPCKSIFDRKKPLSENTMKRIARGLKKFVFDNPKPFIVQLGQQGFAGDNRSHDINKPLSTICRKNEHCLVTPIIANNNFNNAGASVEDPLNTVTSQSNRNCLITPTLIQTGYGENKAAGQKPRILDLDKPLNTIPSTCKAALVAPVLCQYHTETKSEDARAYGLKAPIKTLDASNRYALCSAYLAKHFGGNYRGAGGDIEKPLSTITAQDHNAVCTAFISQRYGTEKGKETRARGAGAEAPLPTITAADHNQVVQASFISRQFGTSTGHKMDEPLGTVTANDKSRLVRAFLVKYFSGEDNAQSIDEPLHTIRSHDSFGLITIEGIDYEIVDIGMRMLEPHELFAAQGFPPDYKISFDVNGKPYSKSEQVARCGNSVCPPVVTALVRANFAELAVKKFIQTMAQLERKICNI